MNLNEGEEIIENLGLCLSDYVLLLVLFVIGLLILFRSLGGIFTMGGAVGMLLSFLLAYLVLFHTSKKCFITNQRVCVIEGVLSKKETNIPLENIKEVVAFPSSQGVLHMLNVGKLCIVTASNCEYEMDAIPYPKNASEAIRQRTYEKMMLN